MPIRVSMTCHSRAYVWWGCRIACIRDTCPLIDTGRLRVPAGHGMGTEVPDGQYDATGHGVVHGVARPVSTAKVPGEHGVQVVALAVTL